MKPTLTSETPEAVEADALAIVLFEAAGDTNPGGAFDAHTQGLIAELYDSKEFTGKAFRTALIHRPSGFRSKRLLLIGGGDGRSSPWRASARQPASPSAK